MSVEAISWALNLAPVPCDSGGKRSSACKAVLIGLANHAGPDGTGAFPSIRTLVRYTDLSRRTVQTALDRLEAAGIIQPCDPAIVAAKIKRADQRPQGWDLAMHLIREDLDTSDLAALEPQFPGLSVRLGAASRPAPARGVRPLRPAPRTAVDNVADEMQRLRLVPPTGCNRHGNGVQPAQERGAMTAPEPSFEPSREPSATPARAPAPAAGRAPVAADMITAFFTAVGRDWPLTSGQRTRLTASVAAALAAGWTPRRLAAAVGANTAGVRNPYAVLRVRLSPAELPPPPGSPSRPPWCGTCRRATRRLESADGSDAGRCPTCNPLASAFLPTPRPG